MKGLSFKNRLWYRLEMGLVWLSNKLHFCEVCHISKAQYSILDYYSDEEINVCSFCHGRFFSEKP